MQNSPDITVQTSITDVDTFNDFQQNLNLIDMPCSWNQSTTENMMLFIKMNQEYQCEKRDHNPRFIKVSKNVIRSFCYKFFSHVNKNEILNFLTNFKTCKCNIFIDKVLIF